MYSAQDDRRLIPEELILGISSKLFESNHLTDLSNMSLVHTSLREPVQRMIFRKVSCKVGSEAHNQFYIALKSNPSLGAYIETYTLYLARYPTRGELRDTLDAIRFMPNLQNFIYEVREHMYIDTDEYGASPEAEYPEEHDTDANDSVPPEFWEQRVHSLHEVNDRILKNESLRKANLKSFHWIDGDIDDRGGRPKTDFVSEGVLAYLHEHHPNLESTKLCSMENGLDVEWAKSKVDPRLFCANLQNIGGSMETINNILPGRALVKGVSIYNVSDEIQLRRRADLLHAWRNIEYVRLFGLSHTTPHYPSHFETEAVEYILENCPNLKILEFRTCLSLDGLEAFKKKPPRTKLEELTLHIEPLRLQFMESRDEWDKLKQYITDTLHLVIDSGWAKKVAIVWPGWAEGLVMLELPMYNSEDPEMDTELLETRKDDGVFSMARAFCLTALEHNTNEQLTGEPGPKSYPTIEFRELDTSSISWGQ